MSSNDDQSRQRFLEMMIQELSRQQNEDATSFFAPPPPAEDALFRKMCFDFPEMSDDSLSQLATATNKCIEYLTDTNALKKGAKSAFDQVFGLHDTFVENVVTMCNAVAAPDSTKTNESLPQGKHKLACVLFLRVPKFLLQSNADTLLPLINAAANSVTWKDIILKFQSFVSLSTVSIIAAGSSNAAGSVQQLLADSACLADTCAVVAELGAFLVQAEQLLGQLDTSTAPIDAKADFSAGELENTESGETAKEKANSTLSTSLQLLDSLGKIGTKSNNIPSLSALLQTLLSSARSASTVVHNEHTQRLSAAVTVLKASWLHLTFLVRDLLLLFPSLIPSKAVNLLKALHIQGEKDVFSMRKADLFPTSAECLYVLCLSSLAAHVCSDSRSNDANSNVLVYAQAKEALRMYLETSDNLSAFVTLCGRMNKYSNTTSTATTSSTTALCIDAESSGFLIDAGMLYLSDPGRVRTSAAVSGSAYNSTTPGLISSQLLSTLLFTLVGVLQQVLADRQSVYPAHNPTLLAFTARYAYHCVVSLSYICTRLSHLLSLNLCFLLT